MVYVDCRVTHETAGDRIEIHVGSSAGVLQMAGVLWVNREHTAEIVRRLQGQDTEPDVSTPVPAQRQDSGGGSPGADENPWFTRPGRVWDYLP